MFPYNPYGEPQVAGVSANSVEIVKALYRDMSDSMGGRYDMPVLPVPEIRGISFRNLPHLLQ